MTVASATTAQARAARIRRAAGSWRVPAGMLFVLPYLVILVLFGVVPVVAALYLAVTDPDGGFVGLDNIARVVGDFRFGPGVGHVAAFMAIWLVALTVLVVSLALVIHRLVSHRSRALVRFAYYVPGTLAGASSVLLWLFILDPSVSPVGGLWKALGADKFTDVISPGNLPFVFAVIAFWTGAGGWIIVLYGALNTISQEIVEAARVDGAGPFRTAWSIELPMIRKWVAYMLVLSFAAGTQLFVEPQLVSQASFGIVPVDYSVNQLAYQYAFTQNDFHGSAAIAALLLLVALVCSTVFVTRGKLFETE